MLALGLMGFLAVGLSLGLLGGGGSILAVPVLVYVLGLPASIAVPMSLPVVGVAAGVGAFARWRKQQLRVTTAIGFAAVAMVSAFASARLGTGIPDRTRLILFVVVMLTAATVMWRRSRKQLAGDTQEIPVTGGAGHSSHTSNIPTMFASAVVVGTLTGLVGVGGGFMIVPALVGVLALPMPQAIATSLAVIALNTLAAGAGWWGRVTLDWGLTAAVTAAALVGMAIGIQLAPRFSARTLTRTFAVLLLAVSGVMIVMEM
jgi:uncharacterized membrane protein YfcA